ncbi:alpha/beta hydrolase [Chloroflexus sp.]|uniref:alpha/beta fold hydrolase n=1 Tax=Chloroflexus sp. TaxID=1904827 RepID=UPI00298F302D|nr:alpha/beta hydrolase [Chloroflexus sp.]MDW8404278.1 alpha/beta hydrolase [Chloroflexus sp.]
MAEQIATGAYTTHLNRQGPVGQPAILFIHGSGPGANGWSNWQLALPALSEQWDCLAPDLVGFGDSQHPDPPPGDIRRWMRLWVDQMLALLDTLGIAQADLVGNSMGGAVALHLLLEAPQRFRRVVLMGAIGAPCRLTPELDRLWGFYDDPSPALLAQAIRWFVYDDAFVRDRLDEIVRIRYAAAMRADVRRSYTAMFPAPRQALLDALIVPDSALRRIVHPVLLVHGRDDAIVPVDTSYYLLNRLPNAELHVIGRCSHWTQIEHSQRFHQLVRSFLSEG